MQRMLILGLTVALLAVLVPPAEAKSVRTSCQTDVVLTTYSANYHAVRKLHGTRAPGRNIRKWGITTERRSTCRQLRKSTRTLRSMRFSGSTMLSPGQPYVPPAQTSTLTAPAGGALEAIAACESGGDPSAVDASGTYRGKYQFDSSTWASVGGSGDPAAASEAEQDQRAARLYAQRGSSPWPVCGS